MEHLTRIALAGTSRSGGNALAGDSFPSGELLGGINADTEDSLLLSAGIQSVFERAGHVPRGGLDAIAAAPPEVLQTGSERLAGLLQNALATDSRELLIEFLGQMEGSRLLLPPELLPKMLDATDAEVRERLLPVLGERGRWLSAFHTEWSWVSTGIATLSGKDLTALQRDWDEGTIRDRSQVLGTVRRSDPAEGRNWLEQTFAGEKADHRARLLESFKYGLSINDEPFLENCLDDRSSQVRGVAAGLLACLPGSTLAGRMRARADEMLTMTTKGRILKKRQLVCEPPEKIDKTWQRDGIAGKPPSGKGMRSYWAEAVLSAVPPAHWSTRFESTPPVIVAATEDDPFETALLGGWTQAAARFSADEADSAGWLGPLWDRWAGRAGRMKGKGREEAFQHLNWIIPAMSQALAESSVMQLLEVALKKQASEALTMLARLGRPWGVEFSCNYMRLTRRVLKTSADNHGYQWANTLLTAAKALPREVFDAALLPWEVKEAAKASWHTQSIARETERFTEKVRTRQSFYEEIAIQDT